MAMPVTIVASGGLPVVEAPRNDGLPMSPTNKGIPVTIVLDKGTPVTFVGTDGVLWPGGVTP